MPRGLDIDALYARHRDGVLRYFARRTADPQVALDLWAETFAVAVQNQTRFRGRSPEAEVAWLYAIARAQLAGYLRRGYAEQRAVDRLGIERPPVTDELLREVEHRAGLDDVRAELTTALASLTDETRRAIELRVVDELPYPEVAERLSITEVAARARVSRGLQTLSKTLDPSIAQEVAPS